MSVFGVMLQYDNCRSSHEERGLKSRDALPHLNLMCRSSHEERGLKSENVAPFRKFFQSLLSRGAWIEIAFTLVKSAVIVSLLSRGAWIEIT